MFDQVESKKFLHFTVVGVFILIVFASVNLYRGAYLHAFVEIGFSAGAVTIILLFLYHKINHTSTLYLFITLLSLLFLYLFWHGGISHTGIIWSLSFPVFAFMLSDKRNGILFSAMHLMIMLGIFLISQWGFYSIPYDFVTLRQMLSVYILISILAYIYQSKVEESSDLLKKFNSELQYKIDRAIENSRAQELQIFQQAKNAQMGELIGMIAHQWRQPLNALGLIIQKLQLLNERGSLTAKKIEENVTKSMFLIENMSKTINDFMNYLKVDKQRQDFAFESVVTEINSILSVQLEQEQVTLQFDINQNLVIHAYKSELSHVLSNLITNALDAFDGKETANKKIVISAFKDDNKHVLECKVKDNAGGIPEDIIDNIFNPYFTTKEQGKGTGIGLNMTKRIVETLFEGTITVHNDKDGAVFTIRFPLD